MWAATPDDGHAFTFAIPCSHDDLKLKHFHFWCIQSNRSRRGFSSRTGVPGKRACWGGRTGVPGKRACWGGRTGVPGKRACWGGRTGVPASELAGVEEKAAPRRAQPVQRSSENALEWSREVSNGFLLFRLWRLAPWGSTLLLSLWKPGHHAGSRGFYGI